MGYCGGDSKDWREIEYGTLANQLYLMTSQLKKSGSNTGNFIARWIREIRTVLTFDTDRREIVTFNSGVDKLVTETMIS